MVEKNIKFELLEKIAKAVLLFDPRCSFNSLIEYKPDNPIFDFVCKNINRASLKFPSQVYRHIHRNRKELENLITSVARGDVYAKGRKNEVINALKDFNINPEEIKSYRSKNAAIANVCKNLGMNSRNLNSRKKVYYYLKRFLKNDEKPSEESNRTPPELNGDIDEKKSYSSPVTTDSFPCKKARSQLNTKSAYSFISDDHHIACSTPVDTNSVFCKKARFQDDIIENRNVDINNINSNGQMISNDIGGSVSFEEAHNDEAQRFEITPESFNIPKNFNLSDSNSSIVLPVGSVNVDKLPPSSFKQCTILEGSFLIESETSDCIIRENRLVSEYYPSYFRNRIKKFVNNICTIIIKYPKYLKDGSIKIFALCKNNNYKCKKFIILVRDGNVDVLTSSVNFCHPTKITLHVKGIERTLVKKKLLHKKPSEYKRKSVLSAKKQLILAGNLQNIKSDSTIRKIKSEAESHWDRDDNDLIDLIKMQEDHNEYVKLVSMPFNVKTYSKEQLEVLYKCGRKELPIIYFDATGGIVKKPTIKTKRVFLYCAVLPLSTGRIFPIFEMISGTHYSKTIFTIFHDFRVFCEEQNKWPIFGSVVTDFSFANIHAICNACNRMNLLDYLQLTYNIATEVLELPNYLITIHLCCAHLMKNFSKDINECFADHEVREFYKDLLASVINMDYFCDVEDWFQSIAVLLLSPVINQSVRDHLDILLKIRSSNSVEFDVNFSEYNSNSENIKIGEESSGLHKSSYFYIHFHLLFENINKIHKFSSYKGSTNKYASEKFFNLILSKYVPFCPLWTGIILRKRRSEIHVSNSYVENFFGHLKKNILDGNKNLKCSRYLRKSRENILALHKEFVCQISKERLTKQNKNKNDPLGEHIAQETWNKRVKSAPSTHFSGTFLKKLGSVNTAVKNISPEIEEVKIAEKTKLSSPTLSARPDETVIEKCIYCGFGRLDTTTEWVACDACERWIHTTCDPAFGDKTYSGSFICDYCTTEDENKKNEVNINTCLYCGLGELNETVSWVCCDQCNGWIHQTCDHKNTSYIDNFYCDKCLNSFKSKCDRALRKLNEESKLRILIEEKTRNQRESSTWFEERKKRITASNFGTICKARNHKSKMNLAKSLQSNKVFANEATKHGIECEKIALNTFLDKYNYKYKKCGLVIHKDYSFLGGSPDGLLNEDGIIEIKCPFKVRDCDRDETLKILDYINNDRQLKINSNYYFQIQGLLEITNRTWCEFVIYNFKGIQFIQKIERNVSFFRDRMLPNLKEFYYCYYLPSLLGFGNVGEKLRQWRQIRNFEVLSNGLVNDVDYYKNSSRDYVVAKFKNFDCFNQINISDFVSLDDENWITNFVLDVALNLFNVNDKYQIISQEKGCVIFNSKKIDESFIKNIKIVKNYLSIPVLVNQNHHCLVLIDFLKSTFVFLDPKDSKSKKNKFYLNAFLKFIRMYNKVNNVQINDKLSLQTFNYFEQKDNCNCGMFCIRYFECITNDYDLTEVIDLSNYRRKIKYLILHQSDDLRINCLICSNICDAVTSKQCQYCKRLIHNECLSVREEYFINNDVCQLCAGY